MHNAQDHVLYDGGRAPNPRRVAMYLAEKDISVSIEHVDMGNMEHKSDSINALSATYHQNVLRCCCKNHLKNTVKA